MSPLELFLALVIVLLIAAIVGNNYFHAKYKQIVAPIAPTVDPILAKLNALEAHLTAQGRAAPSSIPAPIAAHIPVVTQPTAPPPLIVGPTGATTTAQGDSANPMRGYVGPQGGGFGGFMAEKGAEAPLWSSVANGDPLAFPQAFASKDTALQQAAADAVSRMLTMNDTQDTGLHILKGLSPEAQALVHTTFTTGTGGFASDQAGYDKNRPNQSALYQRAWDAFLR